MKIRIDRPHELVAKDVDGSNPRHHVVGPRHSLHAVDLDTGPTEIDAIELAAVVDHHGSRSVLARANVVVEPAPGDPEPGDPLLETAIELSESDRPGDPIGRDLFDQLKKHLAMARAIGHELEIWNEAVRTRAADALAHRAKVAGEKAAAAGRLRHAELTAQAETLRALQDALKQVEAEKAKG